MIHNIEVYFDGATGPDEVSDVGAWAIFVMKDDVVIHRASGVVRSETINRAIRPMTMEIIAVEKALTWLQQGTMTHHHIRLYGDTLDLVNQLNGKWEVALDLGEFYIPVTNMLRKFKDISFTCITKKRNLAAAEAAEHELRKRGITPWRVMLKKAKEAEVES